MGDTPAPRWPDGQLDRYLTAGSATVDVFPSTDDTARWECLGCGNSETASYHCGESADPAGKNARLARVRAEAHAERCRTIAPPRGR